MEETKCPGGMRVGPTPELPDREISRKLVEIGSTLDFVENITERLIERTHPVTRAISTDNSAKVGEENALNREPFTQLGSGLGVVNERLSNIALRLDSLCNRLEI